jgi:hypothetical protein
MFGQDTASSISSQTRRHDTPHSLQVQVLCNPPGRTHDSTVHPTCSYCFHNCQGTLQHICKMSTPHKFHTTDQLVANAPSGQSLTPPHRTNKNTLQSSGTMILALTVGSLTLPVLPLSWLWLMPNSFRFSLTECWSCSLFQYTTQLLSSGWKAMDGQDLVLWSQMGLIYQPPVTDE